MKICKNGNLFWIKRSAYKAAHAHLHGVRRTINIQKITLKRTTMPSKAEEDLVTVVGNFKLTNFTVRKSYIYVVRKGDSCKLCGHEDLSRSKRFT